MSRSASSSTSRLKPFLIGIWLLPFLGLSSPSLAGMVWFARAIDPSSIDALRSDDKVLEETLFGEQPKFLTERLKKDGHVDFSDKQIKDELAAWVAKRKADDSEVDLDKAWHGIHYLLTGSAEPNGTLASRVIFGGEDIGPNRVWAGAVAAARGR